ncbi:MAG: T3SS effector HopA1 family protein [Hydrococcus sp. Prado102]|jgi:hypothetical protein|nr:T3SS effector HopA1 family protein [Hydrococcus sp. Prado102]
MNQQLLDVLSDRQATVFEDIVNNIQIQSKFRIVHSCYQPLELDDEVVKKLEQLPSDIQHKYLRLQLQNFLYGIYFKGDLRTFLANDETLNHSLHSETLEHNHTLDSDKASFRRLHESNCGDGYFDLGWRVVKKESDNIFSVHKNSLTLKIDRDRHLHTSQGSVTVGNTVAVKMPRNLVEQEFYVAVGNAGLAYLNDNCQTVNIYFNISFEGAVFITKSLTQQLNEIGIPFTFKVLYDPDNYERYDAGVLNFESDKYLVVREILQPIWQKYHSYFGRETPFLTKLLAPGLSLAEVPSDRETLQNCFGINRCRILANALQEAWQNGNNSPNERRIAIWEHFSSVGIDLKYPYLNANSKDVYLPLVFHDRAKIS